MFITGINKVESKSFVELHKLIPPNLADIQALSASNIKFKPNLSIKLRKLRKIINNLKNFDHTIHKSRV